MESEMKSKITAFYTLIPNKKAIDRILSVLFTIKNQGNCKKRSKSRK
jgi:hypothetical protein